MYECNSLLGTSLSAAQSWGTAGAAQAQFVGRSDLLMSVQFIKNPKKYIIPLIMGFKSSLNPAVL